MTGAAVTKLDPSCEKDLEGFPFERVYRLLAKASAVAELNEDLER